MTTSSAAPKTFQDPTSESERETSSAAPKTFQDPTSESERERQMKDEKPQKYPKGLRLTPDEVKFLEGCLLGVAETAKKESDPKLFNMAMGLAQRVSQSEMAGDGVPPELHSQLQDGLNRALQSGKPELAQRAMENFLATMVRLHPDPARGLAVFVINYINNTVTEAVDQVQSQAATEASIQVLERFKIKLAVLTQGYREDDEWPESFELLEYLEAWNAKGISDLEAGKEPWEKDAELQAAIATEQAAAAMDEQSADE
jgi:hypothetical protein